MYRASILCIILSLLKISCVSVSDDDNLLALHLTSICAHKSNLNKCEDLQQLEIPMYKDEMMIDTNGSKSYKWKLVDNATYNFPQVSKQRIIGLNRKINNNSVETPLDNNSKEQYLKNFFVVTAIFNPAAYQSRYTLYHKFVKHMNETGAQLITIECIFPSLNQTTFQVTDSRNPFHIQLKSDSIYWMKENLINIAVSHLPPHAKWVCWLDADVYFLKKNWVHLTVQQLKKYTVVQMFKKAKFLGPETEVLRTDYSFGYSVVIGKIIDQQRYAEWYPHPGFGWAMSVNTFKRIGGLPDFDIMGSGDVHLAFALLNKVSKKIERYLNPQFKSLLLHHSQQTYKNIVKISKRQSTSIVGYVPVTITHDWHGSRKDRQYGNRWNVLIEHDFNYLVDTRRKPEGLLELIPTKPNLQTDIITYFQMRREDINATNANENN